MTAAYVDKATGVVLTPEEWATSPAEIAVIGADTSALEQASPEVASTTRRGRRRKPRRAYLRALAVVRATSKPAK